MRVSNSKARKLRFFSRILPENQVRKLIRRKRVDGESLASRERHKSKVPFLISGAYFLCLSIFGTFVISYVVHAGNTAITYLLKTNYNTVDMKVFLNKLKVPFTTLLHLNDYKWLWIVVLGWIMFILITAILFCKRLELRYTSLAHGQKGDSRLTTIKELEDQYTKIPDKDKSFKGYGGVPISHYLNNYFIDTDTVNTLIIGTSRSGKGETVVFPMIDNLSRAENQSSIVVHDPKGELYASSKDILEKRGYNVKTLNVLDPLNGLAYNPLELILEAWKNRDYILAQDLTNSFSHMIFGSKEQNAGQNSWVYSGAKGMLNGCILGLIYECEKNNELEKVTLYNIYQMLIELGSNYLLLEEGQSTATSYLDAFFNALPQGNIAKAQYGAVSMQGEKGKGTIIGTVLDSFKTFAFENIGKMTSLNELSLRSVGFPKYINLYTDKSKVADKKYRFSIYRENEDMELIFQEILKFNVEGIGTLNFDCIIKEGDLLLLQSIDDPNDYVYHRLFFRKDSDYLEVELLPNEECTLIEDALQEIEVFYSEKPTAIFIISPDYDTSKNELMTVFVDQLYITLMRNASVTRGKKCHRRVHFILDEFGNMSPLAELDKKLTVCLSRNVLFNLFVQSYNQLYAIYNDNVAKVAKENCQNHIYIASTDKDTQLEFAERVGKHTVESVSRDKNFMDIKAPTHASVSEEYLITPERIAGMQEGETIVIRSLHRQDLQRNKVRPYPIFNTQETAFPYRYEFLGNQFDTSKDINDLDIDSPQAMFDLNKNKIDFELIRDRLDQQSEEKKQKKSESKADDYNKQQVSNGMKTEVAESKEKSRSEYTKEEFVEYAKSKVELAEEVVNDLAECIYNDSENTIEEKQQVFFKMLETLQLQQAKQRIFIDQFNCINNKKS